MVLALPCLTVRLYGKKTSDALRTSRCSSWVALPTRCRKGLETSSSNRGAVFRAIDRWEGLAETALAPEAVG